MINYSIMLLIIIILIILFNNGSIDEPFYSSYYNPYYYNPFNYSRYCSKCNTSSINKCNSCINCGTCYTSNGLVKCVAGDTRGPYFNRDCIDYSFNRHNYLHNEVYYRSPRRNYRRRNYKNKRFYKLRRGFRHGRNV